jgi:hypothetical protein
MARIINKGKPFSMHPFSAKQVSLRAGTDDGSDIFGLRIQWATKKGEGQMILDMAKVDVKMIDKEIQEFKKRFPNYDWEF